jgi:hypothetical protein
LPVPAGVSLKSDDPSTRKPQAPPAGRPVAPKETAAFSREEKAPINETILERNGLHVINSRVFSPDRETEKNLDSDFKKLVDSVIGPVR